MIANHSLWQRVSRPRLRAWGALLLLANIIPSARAEWVLSAFSGVSSAENNDLHVREPGGTDLTFHNVFYTTQDFESPQYYGGRLAYFLPQEPNLGFGLEFFHSKIYLNTGDSVRVTGTRGGTPVNDVEPVRNTVQEFSMSHGLNFLTADAMYRFLLGQRDTNFLGRFQPYLGGGIGVVIPHVESTLDGGPHFEEYQVHGPAFQALTGINFDVTRHIGMFAEYKFTYVDLNQLDVTGGSYGLAPMTHHFIFGVSYRF